MSRNAAAEATSSALWMLASTHSAGLSVSGPVAKRVIVTSQMSRPSKLLPMLCSRASPGWRAV